MITGVDGRSDESCFYCYCLSALIKTRSCSVHLRVLFVNQHCFFCPWCPGLAQTARNLILKQHIYTPGRFVNNTSRGLIKHCPSGQRRVSQQVRRLRPLQSGRITGGGWRAETRAWCFSGGQRGSGRARDSAVTLSHPSHPDCHQ